MLFLDARMGGLAYRIFLQHSGLDNKAYPIYTDEQASTELCTQKSIIFNVGSVASTVVAWLYNFLKMKGQRYQSGEYSKARNRVIGSGEIIGDMVNMRICDGHDITKLM